MTEMVARIRDPKTMKQSTGRPNSERFSSEDIAFVKQRILEQYPSLVSFYTEFYEEASSLKFKGHRQPKDVGSITSAFVKFFGEDRALPDWYWIILDDLIALKKSQLPSKQTMNEADNFASHSEETSASEKVKSRKLASTHQVDQNAAVAVGQNSAKQKHSSIVEQLQEKPLLSIRRILLAADKMQGSKRQSVADDILEPECIAVITERFASDSVCDLTQFWGWETHKENQFYAILDAVFSIMAADRDSRVRFIQSMGSWLPIQAPKEKFDYIFSLASMCGYFEALHSGGLVQDIDQVIANSIEALNPADAKVAWICPSFESLLHKFKVLEFAYSPIAVVSLLSKDKFLLAKYSIAHKSHFNIGAVWEMVETIYSRALKEKTHANDPFYHDHCQLLKFHKFLTESGIKVKTTRKSARNIG